MNYPDTVILVFAKAPEEGKVNTRLIPDIGVQAATALHIELLQYRLSTLASARLCEIQLHCTPDTEHEVFHQCRNSYACTLYCQHGRDLGERMYHATRQALENYKHVILLGTDAPSLDAGKVAIAIQQLHQQGQAVFVPAEDGGYVLAGFNRLEQALFLGIDWGTAQVMQQTIRSLKRSGMQYSLLAPEWDIDRYEDYLRYRQAFPL